MTGTTGTTGASERPATRAPSAARRGLQAAAVLSLLAVAWQFVTAGQIVGAGAGPGAHATGAVVLHVVTGLAALAALLDLRSGASARVAVGAGVLLALTFLQAWSGDHAPLTVHVPLSLSVVVGAVWLLAAAVGVGVGRSRER